VVVDVCWAGAVRGWDREGVSGNWAGTSRVPLLNAEDVKSTDDGEKKREGSIGQQTRPLKESDEWGRGTAGEDAWAR
jgi:hypothetical protein